MEDSSCSGEPPSAIFARGNSRVSSTHMALSLIPRNPREEIPRRAHNFYSSPSLSFPPSNCSFVVFQIRSVIPSRLALVNPHIAAHRMCWGPRNFSSSVINGALSRNERPSFAIRFNHVLIELNLGRIAARNFRSVIATPID